MNATLFILSALLPFLWGVVKCGMVVVGMLIFLFAVMYYLTKQIP